MERWTRAAAILGGVSVQIGLAGRLVGVVIGPVPVHIMYSLRLGGMPWAE